MISPLFFPYTYISDTQREKILTVFGSLAMFSTRKGLEHSDPRIKTLVPVSGDENRLVSFLKEYSQYANNNMDRGVSFFKGRGGTPMVEPDGVPAIRSEILKSITDGPPDDSGKAVDLMEYLFRARVLLEIAHDYDEKLCEIDQEMENITIREKMLLDQLQGGDGSDQLFDMHLSHAPDHSADMSVEHRLSAWADLFIHAWPDSSITGDGIFLTTSQMVIDILAEHIPEFVKVKDVEASSTDNEDLSILLRDLATCDYVEKPPNIRSLMTADYSKIEVYVVHDVSPAMFFSRLTGVKSGNEHQKGNVRNSVICFFT